MLLSTARKPVGAARKQPGFTLIELLLAMSIFSLVIIVFSLGFIGISKTFSRGVIRKQLSESVQRSNEIFTRTLRASGQSELVVSCDSRQSAYSSSLCPPQTDGAGWRAICLNASRFYWQYNTASGGLYQDTKGCTAAVDPVNAEQIVLNRFKIDHLEIGRIQNSLNFAGALLFQVNGVFRTPDDEAFIINSTDPLRTRCKGTASSSLSFGCAIENFNLVINGRGTS